MRADHYNVSLFTATAPATATAIQLQLRLLSPHACNHGDIRQALAISG